MRQAMATAPVGDDVYGEDPSVNRLQELAAERTSKEAGLFVSSGTMGNLAAILAHCGRGDEVILGDQAHTLLFEAGGISALGGVHSRQIPNKPDGTLDLDDIRSAIRPDDEHQPITRLITLENTHNRCGGVPLTVEYTQVVGDLAREHDLWVHMDGARLFNAAAALGVSAQERFVRRWDRLYAAPKILSFKLIVLENNWGEVCARLACWLRRGLSPWK
jgi:threonine aldolase